MPASEVLEVNKIYQGDAEYTLKTFDEDTFDSFVSDPPYGLKFMGKHWDHDVPKVSVFKEMYRTLKPGGYILIACGTRTQHRMAVNIEDAGFEIRDVISWLYGSGFPKSLDIGKAVDKIQGNDREKVGEGYGTSYVHKDKINFEQGYRPNDYYESNAGKFEVTKGKSEWEGWGTALKPAQEFWTLARKPLSENTVAENVLKHGTGGINIDACRIKGINAKDKNNFHQNREIVKEYEADKTLYELGMKTVSTAEHSLVRFPANVIFDEFMGKELDKQTGNLTSGAMNKPYEYTNNGFSLGKPTGSTKQIHESNEGGASRFFYCAKADNFQRNKGLKDFDEKKQDESRKEGNPGGDNPRNRGVHSRQNHHPTVKPIDLMRYLVKLITPKGGLTCDPFCGSGTTLIGAKLELINFIGIEREKEYREIAEARVAAWNPEKYKEQELF